MKKEYEEYNFTDKTDSADRFVAMETIYTSFCFPVKSENLLIHKISCYQKTVKLMNYSVRGDMETFLKRWQKPKG